MHPIVPVFTIIQYISKLKVTGRGPRSADRVREAATKVKVDRRDKVRRGSFADLGGLADAVRRRRERGRLVLGAGCRVLVQRKVGRVFWAQGFGV